MLRNLLTTAMEEQYAIFRKFPNLELATELKELLENHNIPCLLGDNVPSVDVTFSGNTLQHEVEVRIPQEDFETATKLLEKNAKNIINEIDRDYYLFDFTNEELYEILLKSDEWSAFDYTLAQNILLERGKPVDESLLNSLKNERLKDLAAPEGNQKPWIIAGYVFSFLGGFLGLIIGYFLWTSKKVLPNGQKVYSYAQKDRKHGKYIFYIGLILIPLALLIRVFLEF
ncbi:hypothetical protein GCM10011344_33950 [Dokdonia pacifica]|uniref:Putative signal transducing protein n=2 Tax=Dokdonia pacifica TaxID=1627892 RepID=A0A239BBM2_9FLAO|nr:DUF2007 domain-containing protein [Dokdonia pacifica]GGG30230.1 hypothetical protein GCM10011344_33950 [Dokdonia pacifica]SNS05300.1 Putative signal transducing protein [Dokdonia pacifica]